MLDLIFAAQLFMTDPSDTPTAEPTQEQLCEEQIGRRIDVDNQPYVVVDVDENCDPVLELINEDSPLWDCTTMGNETCGVEIDGVWWLIHYENGCEVSRELRDVVVPPVVEAPPVATDVPVAVVPAPVVEIADAVDVPKQPELAETGDMSGGLAILALVLLAMGISAKAGSAWHQQRHQCQED